MNLRKPSRTEKSWAVACWPPGYEGEMTLRFFKNEREARAYVAAHSFEPTEAPCKYFVMRVAAQGEVF